MSSLPGIGNQEIRVVCTYCDPSIKEDNVSHGHCDNSCMHKDMYTNMKKNLDTYNYVPNSLKCLPDFINPDTDFTASLNPLDAIEMKRYWVERVRPYLINKQLETYIFLSYQEDEKRNPVRIHESLWLDSEVVDYKEMETVWETEVKPFLLERRRIMEQINERCS